MISNTKPLHISFKIRAFLQPAVFAACFLALFLIHGYNAKLYHVTAELISIIIAYGIFLLVWPARRLLTNDFLVFLGILYFVVGSLDLLHTLSYKGMGIIPPDSADPATQLWIIARYIESLGLLAAPLFFNRKLPTAAAFLTSLLILTASTVSVFASDIFPACFIDGEGLTPFKIISEYIISAIVLFALFRLWKSRRLMNRNMFVFMAASMVLTIAAELSFTLYTDVYGFFNVLGHGFKILSFYYIYKALIQNALTNPLDVLFADLQQEISNRKRTETNLRQITNDLKEAKRHVEERLNKTVEDKNRLVVEFSQKALQKADFAQNHSRLNKAFQDCQREKEILHKQLNYYVKIVEQSKSDIDDLLD